MSRGLGSKMRSLTPVISRGSELDQKLKEALSNEKWNVPNTTLMEIAYATEWNPQSSKVILDAVWKNLDDKQKQWRRTFKALLLVEALIKRASLPVVEELISNAWRIKRWQEHRVMEDGKDVAEGIRLKSRAICEMLDDVSKLNAERAKSNTINQRMASVAAVPKSNSKSSSTRAKEAPEEPKLGFQAFSEADMEAAAASEDRSGSAGVAKPNFQTLRRRCEQLQQTTGQSAAQSMQMLKEADWDVNAALFLFGMESGRHPERDAEASTAASHRQEANASDSDSSSGSGSDSDSSSEEPPRRKGGSPKQGDFASFGSWPQPGGGPPGPPQGKGKCKGDKGDKGKGNFYPQNQSFGPGFAGGGCQQGYGGKNSGGFGYQGCNGKGGCDGKGGGDWAKGKDGCKPSGFGCSGYGKGGFDGKGGCDWAKGKDGCKDGGYGFKGKKGR